MSMTTVKNDYRSLSNELSEIIDRLQSGELGIDEAGKAYEQGIKLVKQLEKHLETAENHVTELKAKLSE
jgi:exodeoxyribonuclease VII small subunit